MVIVGLNFKKIELERKDIVKGNIKINNNVSIKSVEEKDLALGKAKQSGLNFIFEFVSKYEPDVGEIKLIGDVLFLDEPKRIKELSAQWKKDKKIDKDVMADVLNNVLNKCNIQALILSQDINLPPPIPLPKVQTKEN